MTTTLRIPAIAPGGVPVLGHVLEMKRRPGDFLVSLQDGDPVVRIRLGREPTYVVNDPALIREVLRDSAAYARGGPITERFRLMFGNGLGISEGEFHRRQRAIVQPAFHHSRIVHHAALMGEAAAAATDAWRDGGRVEVDEAMDDLALANITRLIFAAETALDRARFTAAVGTVLGQLFRRMSDPVRLLTKLPTPANRRYSDAVAFIHRTIAAVIADYRAAGTDRNDLLSMMMLARDADGAAAMSDQQLHDEAMTFFIAGSNTVSNTLSWAFHELATHPGVERLLHAEVDEVLAGRPATAADVARLEHTRRVLTETLRARTQGLFLSRVTTRAVELGGFHVPAGATVLYSFHALNHNPRIHPDPERFDPDRWLPERAASVPRGAFIPFSVGVHGCVGDQFAWTAMIVTLATVTARWRLLSVPGHEPRAKPAITMPVDTLPMTSIRRPGASDGG